MNKKLIVTLLALAACTPQHSGFLDDYGKLQPVKDNPGGSYWQTEDIDLRGYDTLMIDPVQLYLAPGTQRSELDYGKLRWFANEFHKALVDALKDYYNFTDKPGPNTLRLRFAISNLRSLPLTDEKDDSLRTDVTAALLEGEARDSMTDKVLAMAVDKLADEEYDQMQPEHERRKYALALCKKWASQCVKWIDDRS